MHFYVFQEFINELQTKPVFFVCVYKKENFKLQFPVNDYKTILAVEVIAYVASDSVSSAYDGGTFLLCNMQDRRVGRERIAELAGRLGWHNGKSRRENGAQTAACWI